MTTTTINTPASPISMTHAILLTSGWLLLFYFALAPVVPDVINDAAGVLAVIALAFGWPGLKRLQRDDIIVLGGFALYVAMALPGLLNNSDWGGAGWRFESYHPFLLMTPMWGLFRRFREELPRYLLRGVVLAGVALGVFTWLRYGRAYEGRVGHASGLNPNIFGHVASLVAFTLLTALGTLRLPWTRRLAVAAAFLGALAATIASGSRGIMIAFVFALAMGATLIVRQQAVSTRKLGIAAGALVLVAGLLWVMKESSYWTARWTQLSHEFALLNDSNDFTYTSTRARVALVMGASQIWQDNFWFGTGLGDAQHDFEHLKTIGHIVASEHPVLVKQFSNHIFHNIFADSFATTGLVGGLTMIVAVLWLPLRYFRRRLTASGDNDIARFAALAGIGLCAINIAFGFDNSWLYLNSLPYTLVLMTALMVISAAPPDGE